jgi:peptidyl-prolyl cis-trans isomerase A (cyclophilin A)
MNLAGHAKLGLVALVLCACSEKRTGDPALWDPSLANAQAPETFRVTFDTTAGAFTAQCTRAWAPYGADRLFNLATIGYYDDVTIFRVVKGFVAQFGLHGQPSVNAAWQGQNLPVDPPTQSNRRGTLTYAMAGSPTTRTTQLFVNLRDNKNLDKMGFAPVCEIDAEGMKVVDQLNGEYGEAPTKEQGAIGNEGNAFLRAKYPNLSVIKTARVEP